MIHEKNATLKNGLGYPILDKRTAGDSTRQAFEEIFEAYKFLPNLTGMMANHPALLNTYWFGNGYLEKDRLFSHIEQQIIFLSVSYDNKCHYCVAAHSAIAKMYGVPDNVIESIRRGVVIPDSKLEALRRYTSATVIKRGRVSEEDIENFLDAGFSKNHILEVIVIVSLKVLTNYLNYVAKTPVDDQFLPMAWHVAE